MMLIHPPYFDCFPERSKLLCLDVTTHTHTLSKLKLYLGEESGLARLLALPYGKRLFRSRDTAVGRREERQTKGSTCSPRDMLS